MARFGRIAQAGGLGRPDTVPNALFDAAEADHAAQRTRLNALLLDREERDAAAHPLFGGMDDAARQRAAQRLDATSRTAMALLALPTERRPDAYGLARRHLLDNGLAASLPEEYPGDAALEVFARQGVEAGQQLRALMATPSGAAGTPARAAIGAAPEGAARASGIGAAVPAGAGLPGFADRVVSAESGGDPLARNPRSSAAGAGQFLDATWLELLPEVRPDLAEGRSREDQLALRSDPALSRQMVAAYAARNAGALRRSGIEPDDAALMLAHRFGPGGAAGVLRADPGAPAAAVLGADAAAANPELRGLTAAGLVAQARRLSGLRR